MHSAPSSRRRPGIVVVAVLAALALVGTACGSRSDRALRRAAEFGPVSATAAAPSGASASAAATDQSAAAGAPAQDAAGAAPGQPRTAAGQAAAGPRADQGPAAKANPATGPGAVTPGTPQPAT